MLNPKVKVSVWNQVFKPKGTSYADRRMYSNREEHTIVSDGHWLITIPKGTIPSAYLGFVPGEGGTYNKGENSRTDHTPDFDAVINPTKEYSGESLVKSPLVYVRENLESCIFYNEAGELFTVDRKYIELIEGLFNNPSFRGNETTQAIAVYSGDSFCGLVMPVKAKNLAGDIDAIAGK